MKRNMLITLLFSLILLTICSAAMADGFVVIAHPSWPEDTISGSELRAIYLGMRPIGPEGDPVTAYTRTRTSLHEQFVREIIGMTPRQFIVYWKRAVFTGTGIPPVNLKGDEAVVSNISRTPGAIGYVVSGSANDTVKILDVID